MNPEDIGSKSAAVFYCAPSTLRFDSTINYRRCAVSFPMSVKRYRSIDFLCAQLFRWKSLRLSDTNPVNFDPDWSSAYQAFRHRTLNPSRSIFLSPFFLSLICIARIKDIRPFVHRPYSSAFLNSFCNDSTRTYRNKICPRTIEPLCCVNNLGRINLIRSLTLRIRTVIMEADLFIQNQF